MRFFVYSLLILSFLNANNLLDEKIENLIGTNNFIKHRNLISSLTVNKSLFYTAENLNYNKVLNMLKKNGLLKLRFKIPKNVEITFKVKNNSIKAMKILKDTLASLGYSYYFTESLNFENDMLIWKISFKSEYMLDPYILNKELNYNEARIININKISQSNWIYDLNMDNAKIIEAVKIQKNEKIRLKKPLKPYLFRVENAKQISILSRRLNHWYPKITFFRKDLEVLRVVKKDIVSKGMRISVPQDTYYIKIEDNYALLNIKRGLTIIVR